MIPAVYTSWRCFLVDNLQEKNQRNCQIVQKSYRFLKFWGKNNSVERFEDRYTFLTLNTYIVQKYARATFVYLWNKLLPNLLLSWSILQQFFQTIKIFKITKIRICIERFKGNAHLYAQILEYANVCNINFRICIMWYNSMNVFFTELISTKEVPKTHANA